MDLFKFSQVSSVQVVELAERESIISILRTKQFLYVVSICVILLSSLVIVDIVSAGYEYEISEPSLSYNFPDTLVFYNTSEGASANIFSFIVELPVKHSGHHHIVPREISLLFWFRDVTNGTNLSQLISDVFENRRNGTFDIAMHDYDRVNRNESGLWAPFQINLIFYDHPNADSLRFGLEVELMLINYIDDFFTGLELDVQLEMNVTYSRWWFGINVAPLHQIVTYNFNLTENGFAEIVKLQNGMP